MKLLPALIVLATLGACRSAPDVPETPEPRPTNEAASPVWTWTDVEVMGQHTVSREAILAETRFEPGTEYATDREGWERLARHLEHRFGFAEVRVSAVRFVGFEAFLLVDVVERGDEHRTSFRTAPDGDVPLADDRVARLFDELDEARQRGFEAGTPAPEHADEGFLDFREPELHALVLQLRDAVPPHREGLLDVIAHDRDAEKRARAATLLNWGGDVADSIARVYAFADDPDGTVRNNVTRFMLHYLDRVESSEVRRGLVEQLARQLQRPSHADRNKAAYGLLRLVRAWPDDLEIVDRFAGGTLRTIARDSILSNVKKPAADLVELIEGRAERRDPPR